MASFTFYSCGFLSAALRARRNYFNDRLQIFCFLITWAYIRAVACQILWVWVWPMSYSGCSFVLEKNRTSVSRINNDTVWNEDICVQYYQFIVQQKQNCVATILSASAMESEGSRKSPSRVLPEITREHFQHIQSSLCSKNKGKRKWFERMQIQAGGRIYDSIIFTHFFFWISTLGAFSSMLVLDARNPVLIP